MKIPINFKTGTLIGIVVAFLVSSTAFASGSPWEELRLQIEQLFSKTESLQSQIDTIEASPGPQGPVGPQGPQGPEGQPGPSIDKDRVYVSRSGDVAVVAGATPYGPIALAHAYCDDNNDVFMSGGFTISQNQPMSIIVIASAGMPTDSPASWTVAARDPLANNPYAGYVQSEIYCYRID